MPRGNGWSSPSGAGLGATENLCAKAWCKMLLMMWTSILVLGSVGTLGCCSRAGASWDGCRVSLLEQDLGIQKPCAPKCGPNAGYAVDANLGFGVLGHLGMGSVRWCMWGWMELAFWSRDVGHPENMCAKVWCKTLLLIWTSTLVLGS